jgi:hypothetical protein
MKIQSQARFQKARDKSVNPGSRKVTKNLAFVEGGLLGGIDVRSSGLPDAPEALEQLTIECVGQFAKLSHYYRPVATVHPYMRSQTDLKNLAAV